MSIIYLQEKVEENIVSNIQRGIYLYTQRTQILKLHFCPFLLMSCHDIIIKIENSQVSFFLVENIFGSSDLRRAH